MRKVIEEYALSNEANTLLLPITARIRRVRQSRQNTSPVLVVERPIGAPATRRTFRLIGVFQPFEDVGNLHHVGSTDLFHVYEVADSVTGMPKLVPVQTQSNTSPVKSCENKNLKSQQSK